MHANSYDQICQVASHFSSILAKTAQNTAKPGSKVHFSRRPIARSRKSPLIIVARSEAAAYHNPNERLFLLGRAQATACVLQCFGSFAFTTGPVFLHRGRIMVEIYLTRAARPARTPNKVPQGAPRAQNVKRAGAARSCGPILAPQGPCFCALGQRQGVKTRPTCG